MKKSLVFLLALAFAVSVCTPVFAANGVDLACGYSIKENDKVIINVSIVDIKDSTGVAIVDYLIKYDDTVLRLDNGYVNLPKQWEPFTKDEMAENLSQSITGGYRWSVVNAMPGYGITADNELYVTLEFTRLKNTETDIEVIYKAVANDNVDEIYGPDKTITVPISSGDSNSDASESSTNSSELNSSVSDESGQNPESSEADSSAESIAFESVSDSAQQQASDNQTNDSNVWVIILGIFGGIAVIVGIVYLVLLFSKKGKK